METLTEELECEQNTCDHSLVSLMMAGSFVRIHSKKCWRKMENVRNWLWLHTEDKDLHPPAAELLGVTLHWILRFAICDDHQNSGKTFPGAGLLGESIFQHEVEGVACRR